MTQSKKIRLDDIREKIAETIWQNVTAPNVPSVCLSLGIQDAVADSDATEAYSSKKGYVRKRLLQKPKDEVFEIAGKVLEEFDAPKLRDFLSENTLHAEHRVSVLVRKDVLKALNVSDDISGDTGLLEMLSEVFGNELLQANIMELLLKTKSLSDEITQHYIFNRDWTTEELLIRCGALTCSQTQFFDLLTKILHPLARRGADQEQLAEAISAALRRDGFEARQNGSESGYAIYGIVRVQHGVKGTAKNLIFASIGEKPELVFQDAVNNDVRIVKNADKVLIFDKPLPPSGRLLWSDLASWWQEQQGTDDGALARKTLYNRLLQSVTKTGSPREIVLFRAYHQRLGPVLKDSLPVLIPQVYLHYDPYTKRERGDEQFLVRQRMDFLIMLENGVRIVIEVDGRHHFESPTDYGIMCAEDRRLRLLGYEVYRLGAAEFSDTVLSPLSIGPKSEAVAFEFFERLLRKHGVLKGTDTLFEVDERPH